MGDEVGAAPPGAGLPGTVPGTPVERFAADLTRTVDRLRTLGLARLEADFAPEPTRLVAARAVASHLADLAADLEGGPHRELPVLAAAACGDQLAVCGHDVLAAYAVLLGGGAHDPAVEARILAAADLLLDLRRRL